MANVASRSPETTPRCARSAATSHRARPNQQIGGGPSSEHEVSLATSREILRELRDGGHAVRPVLIDRQERWAFGGAADDFAQVGPPVERGAALARLREQAETAYIGLHGPFGEDGTLQRLLEDAGVPYTGCGPAASALGMDKALSKLAAAKTGAHTASHEVLSGKRLPLWGIARGIGYPCFVKPVSGGSSVGVSRVDNEASLSDAVRSAQAEDPDGRCMVEAAVEGPEVTCGVLRRDGRVVTLPLIEITPASGFYDYHAKYESEATRLQCPAPVADAVRLEVERVARELYERLELRGVVRLDFLVRRSDGQPIFLELNTLPGFTSHSLVPLAARSAGWSALEVLEAVLADTGRAG